MQLVPILIVAVVMAADELRPIGAQWHLPWWSVAALALAPVLLLVVLAAAAVTWSARRIDRVKSDGAALPSAQRAVAVAERTVRACRGLLVVNHVAAVLVFGWLGAVRSLTGNVIFLDEFIAILPPILGLLGTWWAQYPLECRFRESLLTRRLDEGRPIFHIPSRFEYVLLQARLNLLVLLVPVLIIVAAKEAIDILLKLAEDPESVQWLGEAATIGAGASVLLISPLLARVILDVRPLAPGTLRQMLLEVCARHRVRVRELLLWNTHGTMINAAVMGLVAPLRYIMITDALLETLRENEVRAVMAHEIGHVRRHHMPWLIACLMAAFVMALIVVELPLRAIDWSRWSENDGALRAVVTTSGLAQLAVAFGLFGWICRRFERQADTFAVQHLSGTGSGALSKNEPGLTAQSPQPLVRPEAVNAMCGALSAIAHLNTIDPRRPGWRHGSIEWRMRYLTSIIGLPVAGLPIDRVVRRIKLAAALVLLAALAYGVMDWKWSMSQPRAQEPAIASSNGTP
jgi:Zn-dependent protease with chaperone function